MSSVGFIVVDSAKAEPKGFLLQVYDIITFNCKLLNCSLKVKSINATRERLIIETRRRRVSGRSSTNPLQSG